MTPTPPSPSDPRAPADSITLAPCPFCGDMPEIRKRWLHNGDCWYVMCRNDDCEVNPSLDYLPTQELAVSLWGKRPALAAPPDLRGVVRNELLNTPELRDFSAAVTLEALHQRERWGADQDAGKAPADWFWLLGYLAGKALAAANAGNTDKALHHTISSAAALANWHAALLGADNRMRPGIEPPAALLPAEPKEPDHD